MSPSVLAAMLDFTPPPVLYLVRTATQALGLQSLGLPRHRNAPSVMLVHGLVTLEPLTSPSVVFAMPDPGLVCLLPLRAPNVLPVLLVLSLTLGPRHAPVVMLVRGLTFPVLPLSRSATCVMQVHGLTLHQQHRPPNVMSVAWGRGQMYPVRPPRTNVFRVTQARGLASLEQTWLQCAFSVMLVHGLVS
jgi:hypothetical protein